MARSLTAKAPPPGPYVYTLSTTYYDYSSYGSRVESESGVGDMTACAIPAHADTGIVSFVTETLNKTARTVVVFYFEPGLSK
jgi:hypothetical protein